MGKMNLSAGFKSPPHPTKTRSLQIVSNGLYRQWFIRLHSSETLKVNLLMLMTKIAGRETSLAWLIRLQPRNSLCVLGTVITAGHEVASESIQALPRCMLSPAVYTHRWHRPGRLHDSLEKPGWLKASWGKSFMRTIERSVHPSQIPSPPTQILSQVKYMQRCWAMKATNEEL